MDVDALLTNPLSSMSTPAEATNGDSDSSSAKSPNANESALEGAAEAIALLEAMQQSGGSDEQDNNENDTSTAAAEAALGDSFGEAPESDAAAAALRQEIEAEVKAEVDRKKRAQV